MQYNYCVPHYRRVAFGRGLSEFKSSHMIDERFCGGKNFAASFTAYYSGGKKANWTTKTQFHCGWYETKSGNITFLPYKTMIPK